MAPRRQKSHGVGAVVKLLLKFIHPSELVRNKYPNIENGQRLEGCVTKRQEVKRVNRKDQLSLVVRHEDFKDGNGELQELHAVKKHFIVEKEGDADYFFDEQPTGDREGGTEADQIPLPEVIDRDVMGQNHGGAAELIAALTGVVDIDDDNQPEPENIPEQGQAADSVLSSEWEHHGFCFRRQETLPNTEARFAHPIDTTRNDINLQLFEILFPN